MALAFARSAYLLKNADAICDLPALWTHAKIMVFTLVLLVETLANPNSCVYEGCRSAWLHLGHKSFLVLKGSSSSRFNSRVTVTARSVSTRCLRQIPAEQTLQTATAGLSTRSREQS